MDLVHAVKDVVTGFVTTLVGGQYTPSTRRQGNRDDNNGDGRQPSQDQEETTYSGPPFPLLNFPPELLLHVLTFIDEPMLLPLSMTCKSLHEILADESSYFWEMLCERVLSVPSYELVVSQRLKEQEESSTKEPEPTPTKIIWKRIFYESTKGLRKYADKLNIIWLNNDYWALIPNEPDSHHPRGVVAHLQYVWWFHVFTTFAFVPRGTYRVVLRVKLALSPDNQDPVARNRRQFSSQWGYMVRDLPVEVTVMKFAGLESQYKYEEASQEENAEGEEEEEEDEEDNDALEITSDFAPEPDTDDEGGETQPNNNNNNKDNENTNPYQIHKFTETVSLASLHRSLEAREQHTFEEIAVLETIQITQPFATVEVSMRRTEMLHSGLVIDWIGLERVRI